MVDSCSTIYSQNPPSNVAKMCSKPKLLLATDSSSPFSTFASRTAVEPQLKHQASMAYSMVTPMLPKTPINTHNSELETGVMGMISSLEIWQWWEVEGKENG